MSFKRDGDNPDLLGNLRKRRVQELFAESIPEDEAFLMRNGRFACTVCNQRPVFDTVSMLAVHRQGKKHLASVYFHEQKKKELETLVQKRKQAQFIKDGTTEIGMPSTQSTGLLGACCYDSRSKRSKGKPYDRKVRLCLKDQSGEDHAGETSTSCLPGHSKTLYQHSGPLIHSRILKQVFRDDKTEPSTRTVSPYVSKNRSKTLASNQCGEGTDGRGRLSDLNFITRSNNVDHTEPQVLSRSPVSMVTAPPPPPPLESSVARNDRFKTKGRTKCTPAEEERMAETRLKTEQYLRLTESGWKKDRGGNWVRDEDVEFDSDEETPTL